MVGICGDGRFFYFFKRTIGTGISDISLNGVGKEENILHGHADIVSQLIQIQILYVDTIHKYIARSCVIKTAQQVHDGGFSGSRRAENTYCLAGLHRKAHILYNILAFGLIGDIPEFDASFVVLFGNGIIGFADMGLLGKGSVDLFHGGHETLNIVYKPACHTQRHIQHPEVTVYGNKAS